MKKIMLAVAALVAAFGAFALGSCATCPPNAGMEGLAGHNSRLALDWWGVYEGVIPSASGSGIEVSLTLRADHTFELVYDYIGREGTAVYSGTFSWNDSGSAISLDGQEGHPFLYPPFYQVGEGFLRQLDVQGNPIVGSWADSYLLLKAQ